MEHTDADRAEPITVFLADDNLIVREGVRALIQRHRDLSVVGVAEDYSGVIDGAAATGPQVLVTDIRIVELADEPVKVVWPHGITIRTAENDDDLRAAHAAYQDAFRDHWGHTEQSYEEFARSMIEIDTFDPSLWFMATDGNQVAGIALGEILPDRGWVNDLAVRRAWRGRGLGGALLRHTFGEFYRRGLQSVGLGVDSQNLTGATRLYERAGMRIEREYSIYEKVLRPAKILVE